VEIVYDGPVAPYRQIADWLRGRIEAGEFRADQRIPSETDLVQELGVARVTARKAVAVLREEGLVYTVHARGTFVAGR
jgi:GntR family transcriptional regulator